MFEICIKHLSFSKPVARYICHFKKLRVLLLAVGRMYFALLERQRQFVSYMNKDSYLPMLTSTADQNPSLMK